MSLKLLLHALLPALDLRSETEVDERRPRLVEVKHQEDDADARQRSLQRRMWRQRRAARTARASHRTSRSPLSLW